MADVQPENGYTKIADAILEAMARIKLSPTQYRILFLVWRFTYGFNRKEHEITLGFLEKGTGCDRRQLQRELKGLEERKIIFQKVTNGKGRKIKFNKNHDEWVGKTAIGEITIGETDNGETVEGTIGETDNGTIGETDNQDIHSLKTILNTEVSQLVDESLSEDEVIYRSEQIEQHYCKRRGILQASMTDIQEIKLLVVSNIPVDFIKSSIDLSFDNYKPKYPKDAIRTFSYLSVSCADRWAKELEKRKPVSNPSLIWNNRSAQRPQRNTRAKLAISTPQGGSMSPSELEALRQRASKRDQKQKESQAATT